MMMVKTEVRPSPIHGCGLFAAEEIAEGALMWQYVEGFDRLLSKDFVDSLPSIGQVYITHRCGLVSSEQYLFTGDDDCFINHSDTPNMGNEKGEPIKSAYALRDIHIGEEITENYATFDAWTRATGNI